MSTPPDDARLDQSLAAAAGGPTPEPETKSKPAAAAPPPAPAPAPPPARVVPAAAPPPPKRPAIGNVAADLTSRRARASREVVVKDAFDYEVAFRLAFLGTGQGGGRMANSFWDLGYRRVAIFNLTDSDFDGLHPEVEKHTLDVGGAAKDAQFAHTQLAGREEEVWDLLTRAWGNEVDYVFVCVGLGGGTGSGTCQQLVELARKYLEDHGRPPRVGAIVSLPTVSEGQQVCRNALHGFKQLMQLGVSPLLVIDNARINEIYSPPMGSLHRTANDRVSQYLHLFNQLAAVHSEYITFDRSELAQLLDGGLVTMGAAVVGDVDTIQSPADISTAIRNDLTQNVLAEVDLRQGRLGCCLFVASEEVLGALSLDYFEAGFTQLDRTIGGNQKSVIHRGVYLGSAPGMQVYTMISGLKPPMARLSQLAKKAGWDEGRTPGKLAAFFGVDG